MLTPAPRFDLNKLLTPRSIVLVGASSNDHIIRGRIVSGVRHLPFAGPVFAISRSETDIAGTQVYPRIEALPLVPDLAVITVPAEHVVSSLRSCGEFGIRAAVIISSGFAEERGDAGAERQRELCAVAAQFCMAVTGPNSEGFLNVSAKLGATFSPAVFDLPPDYVPPKSDGGAVAVVSQSGGIGFSFLDRGAPLHVPFSYVVSTGNEAVVESLDLVEQLLDDPATGVIIMFLEGLRTPSRLRAVSAKAAALGKPLIIAKMGSSAAGASAAASHTASLAGSYSAYSAMMRQHQLLLGTEQDQVLATASALCHYRKRLPTGCRVGVLTPSGGAGIWLADLCVAAGLEVSPLDEQTQVAFRALLPDYGATGNPVDVTAQFIGAHGFARALEILNDCESIDCIIVACSLVRTNTLEKDRENLARVAASSCKPVMFCAYTRANPAAVQILAEVGFPCTASMADAAYAMRAMFDWQQMRMSGVAIESPPVDVTVVRPPSVDGVLAEFQARTWLAEHGIGEAQFVLATTATQAAEFANQQVGRMALKVQSPDIAHKTEVGGVQLNVESVAVAEQFAAIMATVRAQRPSASIAGVLVEPMRLAGMEMLVSLRQDPSFGPMLALGAGGVMVELLGDLQWLPVPCSSESVRAALARLKCWPLLNGYRGGTPSDLDALVRLVVRLGAVVVALGDELTECELNPVVVHSRGRGVHVLDALLRFHTPN